MYYAVTRRVEGKPVEVIAIAKDLAWAEEIAERLVTNELDPDDIRVLWWSTEQLNMCPFRIE